MHHYTYVIQHALMGFFYIGMRSCACAPENDVYWSSSKYLHKLRRFFKHGWTKTILDTYDTRALALEAESDLIRPHLGTEGCINRTQGGAGWQSTMTADARRLLSNAAKARWADEGFRAQRALYERTKDRTQALLRQQAALERRQRQLAKAREVNAARRQRKLDERAAIIREHIKTQAPSRLPRPLFNQYRKMVEAGQIEVQKKAACLVHAQSEILVEVAVPRVDRQLLKQARESLIHKLASEGIPRGEICKQVGVNKMYVARALHRYSVNHGVHPPS